MAPLWRAVLLSRFQCPPILLSSQTSTFLPMAPATCVGCAAPQVIYRDPLSFKRKPQLNLTTPCHRLLNKFSYAPYANEDWIHGTRHLLMATLVGDDKNFPSYVRGLESVAVATVLFSGWFNDWMTILWAPHITLFLKNLWICACTRFPWQLYLITWCRPREMLIKSGRN